MIGALIIAVILASSALYFYSTESTFTPRAQVAQYTTEYPMKQSSSAPNAIGVDSKGNVWFTLENTSSLAELDPSTGVVHQYRIPTGENNGTTTWGLVIDDSRGLVWFTEQSTNSVWSFNIHTHQFTRYELKTQYGYPFGIALDSEGNVWFTEFFGNKIGEITMNGNLTEIPIPLQGYLEPSGITVGPEGKTWFTLPGLDEIGSYYKGQFSFENLTGLVIEPVGISFDQKGNIWMTQHGPSFISEFNPAAGTFKTISTSVPAEGSSLPYFVHVDEDGNVWFNEHNGNAMAEFSPANNSLVEYFIPTRIGVMGNISGMLTSALSPSGVPWYTEFFSGKVGTINTTAPLDLHLSLLNYSGPMLLQQNSNVKLELALSGSAASNAQIRESVGNYSNNFTFSYSKTSQMLTIDAVDSETGVYFITISAITNSLAVSQIIEVDVR